MTSARFETDECRRARGYADDWTLHEADPGEEERAGRHLASCKACAAHDGASDAAALRAAVRASGGAPPALRDAVRGRLREAFFTPTPERERLRRR